MQLLEPGLTDIFVGKGRFTRKHADGVQYSRVRDSPVPLRALLPLPFQSRIRRFHSAPVRSLTEGWVIKVWEKQMTEEGQTRMRFTRSKEGVKARGWISLKAKNGKRLLMAEG